MSYLANLNKYHMAAFLALTVGALILLYEDRSQIFNYYYITDVNYTIKQGGIINVGYGLQQCDSYLSSGLVPIAVEFRGQAYPDAIEYPTTHALDASNLRSYSIWLKRSSFETGASSDWAELFSEAGETAAGLSAYKDVQIKKADDTLRLIVAAYSVLDGIYTHTGTTLTDGAWHHIVWTFDDQQIATVGYKPTLYIDGAAKSVTIVDQPTQAGIIPFGTRLSVGYRYPISGEYQSPLATLYDVRAYSAELSASEVSYLYNDGASHVTGSLTAPGFQGPAIRRDLGTGATLNGTALSAVHHVTENAYRNIGTPYGAPIIRAARA